MSWIKAAFGDGTVSERGAQAWFKAFRTATLPPKAAPAGESHPGWTLNDCRSCTEPEKFLDVHFSAGSNTTIVQAGLVDTSQSRLKTIATEVRKLPLNFCLELLKFIVTGDGKWCLCVNINHRLTKTTSPNTSPQQVSTLLWLNATHLMGLQVAFLYTKSHYHHQHHLYYHKLHGLTGKLLQLQITETSDSPWQHSAILQGLPARCLSSDG